MVLAPPQDSFISDLIVPSQNYNICDKGFRFLKKFDLRLGGKYGTGLGELEVPSKVTFGFLIPYWPLGLAVLRRQA